uniref:Uncharacterized protein n=1 Tax=Anguilla anguilla TaxID=7936 RepID=A0A0E9R1L0_ANGAN
MAHLKPPCSTDCIQTHYLYGIFLSVLFLSPLKLTNAANMPRWAQQKTTGSLRAPGASPAGTVATDPLPGDLPSCRSPFQLKLWHT